MFLAGADEYDVWIFLTQCLNIKLDDRVRADDSKIETVEILPVFENESKIALFRPVIPGVDSATIQTDGADESQLSIQHSNDAAKQNRFLTRGAKVPVISSKPDIVPSAQAGQDAGRCSVWIKVCRDWHQVMVLLEPNAAVTFFADISNEASVAKSQRKLRVYHQVSRSTGEVADLEFSVEDPQIDDFLLRLEQTAADDHLAGSVHDSQSSLWTSISRYSQVPRRDHQSRRDSRFGLDLPA